MKKHYVALFFIFLLVISTGAVYAKSANSNNGKAKANEKNQESEYEELDLSNYTVSSNGNGRDKVVVCHKDKVTLKIASPAVSAHLRHGDHLGECEDSVKDDDDSDDNETENDSNNTISLSILSPLNQTYNQTYLLVNLSAVSENLSNVWYNYNGTNLTYTTPLYINFSEGVNTLHAYANNTFGNQTSKVVVFFVNLEELNDTNEVNDTNYTIPDTITNLTATNVTNDSISWSWINPIVNFFEAILFLNGENVLNTTDSNFTATNLSSGTNYTLDVQTQNNNSLINATNVSSTVSTL